MSLNPSDRCLVTVFSDSVTAVAMMISLYSKSFNVNTVASRIQRNFPNVTIKAVHIAGESNIADGLSRGMENGNRPEAAAGS